MLENIIFAAVFCIVSVLFFVSAINDKENMPKRMGDNLFWYGTKWCAFLIVNLIAACLFGLMVVVMIALLMLPGQSKTYPWE
ncbi:MAG: hypothetical protein ACTHLE_03560 [Agriterribacter sp.]